MTNLNKKFFLEKSTITSVENIVGIENVLKDKADCWVYGYDNSRKHTAPDMVVFPETHTEVGKICKICSTNKIPLTARGRGTNTTGASIPKAGGLVLSFDRMNRIIKIDASNSVMVVQPGVTNGEVQTAAAKHGFFWAPDPTSGNYCT
ncbi:MAG: FAD-binding oxidoreductase, partial [Acidiferrobacterales bacterium]